jgi:hypothetical protein
MVTGLLNGHPYPTRPVPGRRGWGGRRRHAAMAATAAALGLALLTAGPAGAVLGWRALSAYQMSAAASRTNLGTPVREGAVVFVVDDVRCGPDRLGPTGDQYRAEGRFCLVTMTARNDGIEPVRIHQLAQRAHGTAGARYIPDPAAARYANPADDPFGRLPPGGSVAGVLVFDIPPAARLTHVEVHAGVYTRGVAVSVSAG